MAIHEIPLTAESQTFGIPLETVKVNLGSSKDPVSGASGGSITVGGVGGAHRRAAQTALAKIFGLVSKNYNRPRRQALRQKWRNHSAKARLSR